MFDWFDDHAKLQTWLAGRPTMLADAAVVAARASWPGHCDACGLATLFAVPGGAAFDDRPNLREGLRCPRCRMSARQRMLFSAFAATVPAGSDVQGAVLERWSPLFHAIRRRNRRATGSEYLSPAHRGGRRYLWHPPSRPWRARIARHESITALSYADASQDFVVHSDVLEHVADTGGALRECRRVMRPGAAMLFTAPFFPRNAATVVRAALSGDGEIVPLLPPEYHGDGVHAGGIFTFYNFGWDLFGAMRAVFTRVEVGIAHDPGRGLLPADSVDHPANMPAIVFRAFR